MPKKNNAFAALAAVVAQNAPILLSLAESLGGVDMAALPKQQRKAVRKAAYAAGWAHNAFAALAVAAPSVSPTVADAPTPRKRRRVTAPTTPTVADAPKRRDDGSKPNIVTARKAEAAGRELTRGERKALRRAERAEARAARKAEGTFIACAHCGTEYDVDALDVDATNALLRGDACAPDCGAEAEVE